MASPLYWTAIIADGKTLLWGQVGLTDPPMKAVVFSKGGRLFSSRIRAAGLWHITVPGTLHLVYNSQWFVLRNGKLTPMYPPSEILGSKEF